MTDLTGTASSGRVEDAADTRRPTSPKPLSEKETLDRLTSRQAECLQLSATMTDKDIGRHLGISHHTVSLHIREAMRRLQSPSRKAALRALAPNPLYASTAIPLSDGPATDQTASAVSDSAAVTTKVEPTWLLPPPPGRILRLVFLMVFAALAALITVGIVSVVSIAVGNLASHAPPSETASQR